MHEYFLQSNFSNEAKSDFPCLLKKIYENVLCKLSLGVNAFQVTGIFPLDKERVKPTTVDDPESSDDENSATSQSEKNQDTLESAKIQHDSVQTTSSQIEIVEDRSNEPSTSGYVASKPDFEKALLKSSFCVFNF